MDKYNVIVVGAGNAGTAAAAACAKCGLKTLLLERHNIIEIGRASCRERV